MEKSVEKMRELCAWLQGRVAGVREEGQGTVEYAILVGVLAVIAMVAILAFKGKIGELWDAIQNGVNGL